MNRMILSLLVCGCVCGVFGRDDSPIRRSLYILASLVKSHSHLAPLIFQFLWILLVESLLQLTSLRLGDET